MGDLSALKDALFPNAAGMVLDRLTEVDGVVVAEAHSAVLELRCPSCATPSRRVHSRYGRRLAEYPAGGRRQQLSGRHRVLDHERRWGRLCRIPEAACGVPALGRSRLIRQTNVDDRLD
ncbi:hypothetical protein ACWEV4_31370 [Streptomyces sp. NPDC003860]